VELKRGSLNVNYGGLNQGSPHFCRTDSYSAVYRRHLTCLKTSTLSSLLNTVGTFVQLLFLHFSNLFPSLLLDPIYLPFYIDSFDMNGNATPEQKNASIGQLHSPEAPYKEGAFEIPIPDRKSASVENFFKNRDALIAKEKSQRSGTTSPPPPPQKPFIRPLRHTPQTMNSAKASPPSPKRPAFWPENFVPVSSKLSGRRPRTQSSKSKSSSRA
jgi:hypothetical protein